MSLQDNPLAAAAETAALPADATGLDLAKKIFELAMNKQVDPMGHALSELKK